MLGGCVIYSRPAAWFLAIQYALFTLAPPASLQSLLMIRWREQALGPAGPRSNQSQRRLRWTRTKAWFGACGRLDSLQGRSASLGRRNKTLVRVTSARLCPDCTRALRATMNGAAFEMLPSKAAYMLTSKLESKDILNSARRPLRHEKHDIHSTQHLFNAAFIKHKFIIFLKRKLIARAIL